MKANQKFVKADEAVSPVIGVILMVAITVVLAAVVFVLVSDLGNSGDAAPAMSFNKDASAGTVTLVKSDTGLDWAAFTVGGSGCTTYPTLSGSVTAGTVIASGCAAGDTVTVTHDPTNSLVYSTTF